MIENLQAWFAQNPEEASVIFIIAVLILIVLSYVFADRLLARSLIYIARRTETHYDDIIIQNLKPRRIALVAPLLVIYFFAYLVPGGQDVIQKAVIFFLLWLGIFTFNGFLNAVNEIYELRRGETGVAIRGYLDLIKVFALVIGIILSISIATGQSPLALLAGLGALTAVLLLIFRDTILSFVASIQISANDLVNEGDWLEVPAYNADGEVIDITLHQVKIQNWDMTISVIPTYKLLESSYKNWRGMSESGGRRIKRAIHLDLHSIRFCDDDDLEKFKRFVLVRDYIDARLAELPETRDHHGTNHGTSLYAPTLTNISIYRTYVEAYIENHPNIRKDMTMLVRQLEPTSNGLPIEIYAFTDTTVWIDYEAIQANIFDHLLAVVPEFDLRVFQDRSGSDFQRRQPVEGSS